MSCWNCAWVQCMSAPATGCLQLLCASLLAALQLLLLLLVALLLSHLSLLNAGQVNLQASHSQHISSSLHTSERAHAKRKCASKLVNVIGL